MASTNTRALLTGEAARVDRAVYRDLLNQAQRVRLTAPEVTLDEATVANLLRGNVEDGILEEKTEVRIFLSSTFTNTEAERNALMEDAFEYLRVFCRNLGYDFQCVGKCDCVCVCF